MKELRAVHKVRLQWKCPDCGHLNNPERAVCTRCGCHVVVNETSNTIPAISQALRRYLNHEHEGLLSRFDVMSKENTGGQMHNFWTSDLDRETHLFLEAMRKVGLEIPEEFLEEVDVIWPTVG